MNLFKKVMLIGLATFALGSSVAMGDGAPCAANQVGQVSGNSKPVAAPASAPAQSQDTTSGNAGAQKPPAPAGQ
jgi:hypothetical protein